jgi:hypothetical protein
MHKGANNIMKLRETSEGLSNREKDERCCARKIKFLQQTVDEMNSRKIIQQTVGELDNKEYDARRYANVLHIEIVRMF